MRKWIFPAMDNNHNAKVESQKFREL